MVCGRLPFGDDSQVKKMQSQNRQINFSRNLSFGESLLSSPQCIHFVMVLKLVLGNVMGRSNDVTDFIPFMLQIISV